MCRVEYFFIKRKFVGVDLYLFKYEFAEGFDMTSTYILFLGTEQKDKKAFVLSAHAGGVFGYIVYIYPKYPTDRYNGLLASVILTLPNIAARNPFLIPFLYSSSFRSATHRF